MSVLGPYSSTRPFTVLLMKTSLITHQNNKLHALMLWWLAQKHTCGEVEVYSNHAKALKLFRKSAALGLSDAFLRIGQLQLQGAGTTRNVTAALGSFRAAARAGNFVGLALEARHRSECGQFEQADALWERFFAELQAKPDHRFLAVKRNELLHDYIFRHLKFGLEPEYREVLHRHRWEISDFHSRLTRVAASDERKRLRAVDIWLESNLWLEPV